MSLKTILLPVERHDQIGTVFDCAAALARVFGSYVEAVGVRDLSSLPRNRDNPTSLIGIPFSTDRFDLVARHVCLAGDEKRWSVDLRYQPTDQDQMIQHGTGFLARSRRHPERVATVQDFLENRMEHGGESIA